MIWCNLSYSQSSKYSSLFIFENKNDISWMNSKSNVNPNNYMGIKELASETRLFPILSFNDSLINDAVGNIQIESGIYNYNYSDSIKFKFMELYAGISLNEKNRFIIGKKRLDWGSGLLGNPTLFYTQKDPLRIQNRLEGIYQVNYSHLFENSDIGIFIFPDSKLSKTKFAIKYNTAGNRISYSGLYILSGEGHQIGYDISYGADRFTLYTEGMTRTYSRSYGISKDGVLTSPQAKSKKIYNDIVVGASISLSPRISSYLEYRFNEDNLGRLEIDLYKTNLPRNAELYDPISIGKHSIFGSFEYKDLYGRWSLNTRGFYNLFSKQLVFSPLFTYNINNFQVEFSSMAYNNSFSIFKLQSTIFLSLSF